MQVARAGGGRTAYVGDASDWRGGDGGKLLEKFSPFTISVGATFFRNHFLDISLGPQFFRVSFFLFLTNFSDDFDLLWLKQERHF